MTLFALWDRSIAPAAADVAEGEEGHKVIAAEDEDPHAYEERLTARVEELRTTGKLPADWHTCPCASLVAQVSGRDSRELAP